MGLLSGSLSLTRFNVPRPSEAPDFEKAAFREIAPGSEVRESTGIVPMEPGAPFEVGAGRYAFRIRTDRLRPDATAVRERTLDLIRLEMETSGAPSVGPKKRRQLRQLAEEELLVSATPSSKIVECCWDGPLLQVASTAKGFLGTVMALMRKMGVTAHLKTPWLDRGEPEVESELYPTYEPGESVLGCRFLKALLEDPEVLLEPESGYVKLQTQGARVTLSGDVKSDLYRYLERPMEILAIKLLWGDFTFRLEGPSFRLQGLKMSVQRHEHWVELLDERLEKAGLLWDMLDQKFGELAPSLRRG